MKADTLCHSLTSIIQSGDTSCHLVSGPQSPLASGPSHVFTFLLEDALLEGLLVHTFIKAFLCQALFGVMQLAIEALSSQTLHAYREKGVSDESVGAQRRASPRLPGDAGSGQRCGNRQKRCRRPCL